MGQFILNPKFKQVLEISVGEFAREYAQLCRDVIEIERLWLGWETSNPLRDIVDTNALNESMTVEQVNETMWRIGWHVLYVIYVYFGYALPDGRRIPPRQWCQIAIDENNLLDIFRRILIKNLH